MTKLFHLHTEKARLHQAGLFLFHQPLPGFFIALTICGILLLSAVTTMAQSEAQTDDTGALAQLVQSVQENLSLLREKTPDDVDSMAGEYMRLFEAFPDTTEGKLAAVEVFHLFRKRKMPLKAMGQAGIILKFYSSEETFPNIVDTSKPLSLDATMRIARARILMEMDSPISAMETLKGIPSQSIKGFSAYWVDDAIHFGKTKTIISLSILDAAISAQQYQQSCILFQKVLEEEKGNRIYHEKEERPLDVDLLDRLEILATRSGWNTPRRIAEFSRTRLFLQSDRARIKIGEMIAQTHLAHFHAMHHRTSAFSARDAYLQIIDEFGDHNESRITGEGMWKHRTGERLLDVISNIYLDDLKDPSGWRLFLISLTKRFADRPHLHARCQLLAGDVLARQMGNRTQAVIIYKKLLEQYDQLVYYPHVLPYVPRYRAIIRSRLEEIGHSIIEP